MPRGDGTGPMGTGPWGRGRGGCFPQQGFGRGAGMGMCWAGQAAAPDTASLEKLAQMLEQRAALFRSIARKTQD